MHADDYRDSNALPRQQAERCLAVRILENIQKNYDIEFELAPGGYLPECFKERRLLVGEVRGPLMEIRGGISMHEVDVTIVANALLKNVVRSEYILTRRHHG